MTDTANLEQVAELSRLLREKALGFKLGGYDPYPFQKQYHAAFEGRHTSPHPGPKDFGKPAHQVLASAANQIGKSVVGGTDEAIHALGE